MRTVRVISAIVLSALASVPAKAGGSLLDYLPGQFEQTGPFMSFDEFRVGAFYTDFDGNKRAEDGVVLNTEVLFGRLEVQSGYALVDRLLNFRPHVGVTFNSFGGTSVAYVGATSDYALTDWLYLETSFGAAIHDGPINDEPDSLGCTANFRESFGVGVKVSEQVRLLATVDHISNAGLCDENQGLTTAGLRLGYRW